MRGPFCDSPARCARSPARTVLRVRELACAGAVRAITRRQRHCAPRQLLSIPTFLLSHILLAGLQRLRVGSKVEEQSSRASAAASARCCVLSSPAQRLLRRMPEHMLPPYIEANFRLMTFVLTRAPKMSDFPRERLYRPESIDLLFRHYYMSKRA